MANKNKIFGVVLRKWMNNLVTDLSEDNKLLTPVGRAYLTGKWNAFNEIREMVEGEVALLEPANTKGKKKKKCKI